MRCRKCSLPWCVRIRCEECTRRSRSLQTRRSDFAVEQSITDSSVVVIAEMHSRFIPVFLYEIPDNDARVSAHLSGILGGQPDLGRKIRKSSMGGRPQRGRHSHRILIISNLPRSKRHRTTDNWPFRERVFLWHSSLGTSIVLYKLHVGLGVEGWAGLTCIMSPARDARAALPRTDLLARA